MASIYVENLSAECRRRLCARTFTREEVAQLAASLSSVYQLRKRTFRWMIVLLPGMTVLMAVLSYFSPAARAGDMTVTLCSFGFTLLVEIPILAIVWVLAVTRMPRQFARYLKKDYPELVPQFGYEEIVSGELVPR